MHPDGGRCPQKHQGLGVLAGRLTGTEQILAGVGSQGKIVVLAGAIDALEGLLVKQTNQIVLGSTLFEDLHNQLVIVTSGIGIVVDGS